MDQQAADRVAWLRQELAEGRLHTVRLSFADHLGSWRGKRIPVEHFLASHLDQPMGFCDGMIVCDARCDIIQETPFSNFTTGYPDFHVWPDLSRLREVGWAPGEVFVFGEPADHHGTPIFVGPGFVLGKVTDRLAELGTTVTAKARLAGRFMCDQRTGPTWATEGLSPAEVISPLDTVIRGLVRSDVPITGVRLGPAAGEFEIGFSSGEPSVIAESIVIAKGACKEVGTAAGTRATFMTRTVGGSRPSTQAFDIELQGGIATVAPERVYPLLCDARGLLQPSVTAFKAGPPVAPEVHASGDGIGVRGLAASSEADPFVALAVSLAAVAHAGQQGSGSGGPLPRSLLEAAETLGVSGWVSDWLGSDYVDNAIPLLEHEGLLFDEVVSDWELERYWSAS
jgi:glutamine synthetase